MDKQKKGISLIVLVITIIVMIVLASAIVITLSNTNIITKAKEAVNATNEKALQQQADLYAADLILEFREMGYNNLIVPDVAKEAYIDAIKDGKTEEEAIQLANDSFIGSYDDWLCDGVSFIPNLSVYDPIYQEVLRVCDLIWNKNVTEEADLEIGKLAEVPDDLKACVLNEQKAIKAYIDAGETDEAATIYEEAWNNNEPLKGLIEGDETNSYYYLTQALPLRLPRYVYNNDKSKIYDVTKCTEIIYTGSGSEVSQANWQAIPQLILDENFTVLTSNIIPPVTGDCEIILPDTLKTIQKKAFANSTVTKIVIPSSVETIELGAFHRVVSGNGNCVMGNATVLEELIIKKEEGSIPGAPWGLDTTVTTIVWQPEE